MNDSDSPKRKRRWYRPNLRWYQFHPVPLLFGLLIAGAVAGLSFLLPDRKVDLQAGAIVGAIYYALVWFFIGLLWLCIRLIRAVVARPAGWRFQFSLRTLLLFVLLCAIPCSWFATKLFQARRQRAAVAEIRNCGGEVSYSFGSERPWLAKLLGDDLYRVVAVDLRSEELTDADLVHLKGLAGLQELYLGGAQITDPGLVHLEGLTSLEWLSLLDTQITDAGLEHLKGLTSLQALSLDNTGITDAGLEHLKELTSLRRLDLENTQITAAGLEHLQGLTSLEFLDLDFTFVDWLACEPLRNRFPGHVWCDCLWIRVDQQSPQKPVVWVGLHDSRFTDASLPHLKKYPNLQALSLRGTQITDAGLVHLRDLPSLQELYLDNTEITDAGLAHLRELPSLQVLYLDDWEITDAGLKHLKGLSSLQVLRFRNTQITDAGLAHLKGLTSLQGLGLDTQVTDAGLEHLGGLTSLEWLNLSRTQITDAGLKHLSGFTSLQELYIGGIPFP